MKAKLVEKSENHYDLYVDGVGLYTSTYQWTSNGNLLSLKNCQAIERGYDLDELANEYNPVQKLDVEFIRAGFKAGFQKALEILGDRKFTEGDIDKAIEWGINSGRLGDVTHYAIDKFIQSIQQNEWEVEIIMEEVTIGDKYTPEPKPKLDTEGCIILKRV